MVARSEDGEKAEGLSATAASGAAPRAAAPAVSLGAGVGKGPPVVSWASASSAATTGEGMQEAFVDGKGAYHSARGRVHDGVSLGCLRPDNWLRQGCVRVVEHPAFDKCVLLLITVNCAFMAAEPTAPELVAESELVFLSLFTAEALLKVAAGGLVGARSAYLRDPWNWLDFVIVVVGWVPFIFGALGVNLTALRTVRILRPLRTVNHIPGMSVLVRSLLMSLPKLGHVVVLTSFVFLVFGIMGVQVFAGRLHYRCADAVTGELPPAEALSMCCPGTVYGETACMSARACEMGTQCTFAEQTPSNGVTSFDSIPLAMITIFQCITLEGWTDVMYAVMASSSYWSCLYFIVLIIVGAFFVVNLFLAVIADSLQQAVAEDEEKQAALAAMAEARATREESWDTLSGDATEAQGGPGEVAADAAEMNVPRVATPASDIEVRVKADVELPAPGCANERESADCDAFCNRGATARVALAHAGGARGRVNPAANAKPRTHARVQAQATSCPALGVAMGGEAIAAAAPTEAMGGNAGSRAAAGVGDGRGPVPRLRAACVTLVAHPRFAQGVCVLIFLNTTFMACEYHGMDPLLMFVLNTGDLACTVAFTVELAIKCVALTPRGYVRNRWNVFDAIVVFVSWLEIFFRVTQVPAPGLRLSVLRAFRLVRVIRAMQNLRGLQMIVRTVSESVRQIGNLSAILALVIFCFALVGMELFRLRFSPENGFPPYVPVPTAESPRKVPSLPYHFDSFVHACITIFVVLSGENWNEIYADAVLVSLPAASLYFITLVVIGNFVVINLFIAILLGNFADMSGWDGPEPPSPRAGGSGSGSDGSSASDRGDARCGASTPAGALRANQAAKGGGAGQALDCGAGPRCGGGEPIASAPDATSCTRTAPGCARGASRGDAGGAATGPTGPRDGAGGGGRGACWASWGGGSACARVGPSSSGKPLAPSPGLDGSRACGRVGPSSSGKPLAPSPGLDGSRACGPRQHGSGLGDAEAAGCCSRGAAVAGAVVETGNVHCSMSAQAHPPNTLWDRPPFDGAERASGEAAGPLAAADRGGAAADRGGEVVVGGDCATTTCEAHGEGGGRAGSVGAAASAHGRADAAGGERGAGSGRVLTATTPPPRRTGAVAVPNCDGTGGSRGGSGGGGSRTTCTGDRGGGRAHTAGPVAGDGDAQRRGQGRHLALRRPRLSSAPLSTAARGGTCRDAARAHAALPRPASVAAMPDHRRHSASSHGCSTSHRRRSLQTLRLPSDMTGRSPERTGRRGTDLPTTVLDLPLRAILETARRCGLGGRIDRDHALGCMPPDHPIRARCSAIVRHPFFDRAVLAAIAMSSVLLAVDHPSYGMDCIDRGVNCEVYRSLHWLSVGFTVLFAVEMAIKVCAMGLVLHKHAYLRDGWNVLDFWVVVVSLATITSQDALKGLKPLRALRALRPLRMISRSEGMRTVVSALLRAVPGVVNVMTVAILFVLLFGILGMQVFSGRFAFCTDPEVQRRADCRGSFWNADASPPQVAPRIWRNPAFGHFDHLGAAMLLLLEMSTLEMWPDVMYHGMDALAYEKDVAPSRDASVSNCLFFIAWIIVGSFFIFNLLVGVVIDNFNRIKERETGSALLTEDQKQWMRTLRVAVSSKPRRSSRTEGEPWWRVALATAVQSERFEKCVMIVIAFNVCIMATYHCEPDAARGECVESPEWGRVWSAFNYAFFGIYALEAAVKILALGPRLYLSSAWNDFDLALVVLSAFDLALDANASELDNGLPINPSFLRVLRLIRVGRILRLVKQAKGLRALLTTIVMSLPSLANVTSLLLLLLFVYAVLGVQLFWRVAHGEFINEFANFSSFWWALLTLFRCVTGESWNGLMHDCMVRERLYPERCSEADGTCGSEAAVPYFVSFTLIGFFVFLNLVIAVILENFSGAEEAEGSTAVPTSLIDHFTALWSAEDPDANGLITVQEFECVLRALPVPLGLYDVQVPSVPSRADVAAKMRTLAIPVREGEVSYPESLMALLQAASQPVDLPSDLPIVSELEMYIQSAQRARVVTLGAALSTLREEEAARSLQAAYRGRQARQLLAETSWNLSQGLRNWAANVQLPRYRPPEPGQARERLEIPAKRLFVDQRTIGFCVRPPGPVRLPHPTSAPLPESDWLWVAVQMLRVGCTTPSHNGGEAPGTSAPVSVSSDVVVEYVREDTAAPINPADVAHDPAQALKAMKESGLYERLLELRHAEARHRATLGLAFLNFPECSSGVELCRTRSASVPHHPQPKERPLTYAASAAGNFAVPWRAAQIPSEAAGGVNDVDLRRSEWSSPDLTDVGSVAQLDNEDQLTPTVGADAVSRGQSWAHSPHVERRRGSGEDRGEVSKQEEVAEKQ